MMNKLTTKQLQRIEKKKRKIEAFLEIAKLNDKDKEAKLQSQKETSVINNVSSEQNEINLAGEDSNKQFCNMDIDNVNKLAYVRDEGDSEAIEESELQANKKPRLSGKEYAFLKQELRERKKRLSAIPRLILTSGGENATIEVSQLGKRIPIFLSDIQHLLLYSLLGNNSPYLPKRWCNLEKYNKVTHTVVLVIEGLSLYHFMAHESMLPHITNNLKYQLEVVTPAIYGASITEELAAVPLTGTQSSKLIKRYGSLEAAFQTTGNVIKLLKTVFPVHSVNSNNMENKTCKNLPQTDKFCRTKLLLSLWQMVEENYPVPLKGILAKKYDSYILTKDSYEEATAMSPMFALDCEMCRTTSGNLELTRISVVDEKMNIIYDSLVKPENTITNYLTRYSGITKEMLEDVTVKLSDVQCMLRKIFPPDAILVGQSLNSDLHTLKMMHPYIIDTSVIFNVTGDRYRKTKLQILAQQFLGETIQANKAGHCSTEDSKASMKLVQLKLENSVNYGDAVLLGDCDIEVLKMKASAETMSQRALQKMEAKKYATSIFNHVTKDKNTAAIVGKEEVIAEYAKYLKSSSLNVMSDANFTKDDKVRLVIADNDKHAISRSSEIVMDHGFTLCHVNIGEEQLMNERIEKTIHTINKWVDKIWRSIAMNGLACVLFGGQNNGGSGACFLNIKREISPIT
ncbi:RNA exonuclease 5 [Odontomachus brunneus]|uniref:RNA exonuclease 5 n=1 Tax=Odontomachus brunneus TaxID=486640 RepID=UPI0013F1D759|nr:RNA exonuclease 5 [Odontomachus brunneus]XP_032684424.1 RNA exonuclease 5 [Odontomachus brunneus]XP_032684425.1 RNA exonuclease 5 [Odontomachus brunneus]XP_032684426.1 RNA exonuclease 5 [Odontomachus brunneus]XP_032684427.1 RNA exonuclease 5 [Odontomachus brunneus]